MLRPWMFYFVSCFNSTSFWRVSNFEPWHAILQAISGVLGWSQNPFGRLGNPLDCTPGSFVKTKSYVVFLGFETTILGRRFHHSSGRFVTETIPSFVGAQVKKWKECDHDQLERDRQKPFFWKLDGWRKNEKNTYFPYSVSGVRVVGNGPLFAADLDVMQESGVIAWFEPDDVDLRPILSGMGRLVGIIVGRMALKVMWREQWSLAYWWLFWRWPLLDSHHQLLLY